MRLNHLSYFVKNVRRYDIISLSIKQGEVMDKNVDMGYLQDEEIERKLRSLTSMIRSSRFSTEKKMELEIEYCYLYREKEWREKRKLAHAEWLKTNGPPRRRKHRNYNRREA